MNGIGRKEKNGKESKKYNIKKLLMIEKKIMVAEVWDGEKERKKEIHTRIHKTEKRVMRKMKRAVSWDMMV